MEKNFLFVCLFWREEFTSEDKTTQTCGSLRTHERYTCTSVLHHSLNLPTLIPL